MATTPETYAPPPTSLPRLFGIFLQFGLLAFGGPVAQIAMIRQALVDEKRWISPPRFARLLAVMQALPGPEAHELCVHFGMVARGRIGGILAGLGFMLPGFLLMMACGWAYTTFAAGRMAVAEAFLGVQVAVLAIILRAIQRIAMHILANAMLIGIAAIVLVATLFGAHFAILLATAGVLHAGSSRRVVVWGGIALTATAAILLAGGPDFAPLATSATSGRITPGAVALFIAGLKGGLLTFGGAYTAIPYVRADTVGRGWLSDPTFLDGVAIAGLLPAPLVIFATFVGYVAGGPLGAVAITTGMFLPAFALPLLLFERLESLVENLMLHRLLDGVAAAVVGIIAATFLDLTIATAHRVPDWPPALAIFGLTALAVWRLKGPWLTPVLIACGGVAGWLLLR